MKSVSQVKVGLVVSRFNDLITSRLLEGARGALLRRGIPLEKIEVIEVPGAFEIPLAAQWLFKSKGVDAVIALGAVIRGSTSHFEYVCSTTSSGLMSVQLAHGKPIGFGVLTCDTLEQAFDRVGGKLGNKGAEAAETALEMLLLHSSIEALS